MLRVQAVKLEKKLTSQNILVNELGLSRPRITMPRRGENICT